MGLNAVVYVHLDNVMLDQRGAAFKTDEETGEVYIDDPEIAKQYPEKSFIAVDKRLGNLSMIAALRSEISELVGDNCILYSRVLYSGAHSGDVIGLECLDKLESEMNLVREATHNSRSLSLERFLGAMTELIDASRKQKNPIVFV